MTTTERQQDRAFHEVVHDDRTLDMLRPVFKRVNRSMLSLWRLGLGRWSEIWPAVMGRILVVEHYGRKSGRRYLTPLNFTRRNDEVYCVAAFGEQADWYRNATNAGTVVVFLPEGAREMNVVDTSADEDRLDVIRAVLRDAGFASYAAGIDPRRMPDTDLADATAAYRVVRLVPHGSSSKRIDDLRHWWLFLLPATAAMLLTLRRRHRRVSSRRHPGAGTGG